jgi:hypothetical protein
VERELAATLVEHLWGEDLKWLRGGQLIGEPGCQYVPEPAGGLANQRGWRFMGGPG